MKITKGPVILVRANVVFKASEELKNGSAGYFGFVDYELRDEDAQIMVANDHNATLEEVWGSRIKPTRKVLVLELERFQPCKHSTVLPVSLTRWVCTDCDTDMVPTGFRIKTKEDQEGINGKS